jgi:hypothetical protein
MRLHPRVMPCQAAENDLHEVIIDWMERHPDLTWAEAVRCLAGIIASYSKYPVREERHGADSEKRTDEA